MYSLIKERTDFLGVECITFYFIKYASLFVCTFDYAK